MPTNKLLSAPHFGWHMPLQVGHPFEPGRQVTHYLDEVSLPDNVDLPVQLPPAYAMLHRIDTGLSQMWRPPDEMRNQFPIFRLAREGGDTRFQFMPGYPELLSIRDVPPSSAISKQLSSEKKKER
jgi:hypothetical protein